MPTHLDSRRMVLSDRTIREEIAAGRIVIDPFDDAMVQPCSRGRHGRGRASACSATRATRTSTSSVPMDDLTELVTVDRATSRSSCTRASSCWGSWPSGSRCPTTSWPRWTARARWVGWGWSCTRPRAWSTPASTATSRWSWPTWPTFRSPSTRECGSPSSAS